MLTFTVHEHRPVAGKPYREAMVYTDRASLSVTAFPAHRAAGVGVCMTGPTSLIAWVQAWWKVSVSVSIDLPSVDSEWPDELYWPRWTQVEVDSDAVWGELWAPVLPLKGMFQGLSGTVWWPWSNARDERTP